MFELEVRLVEAINRMFPISPNLRELDAAKVDVASYQRWEEDEIKRLIPEFGPWWDIRDKAVLDVGCGLGGKTTYYAAAGARRVTGIDLRTTSLEATRALAQERGVDQVDFCMADAASMPLPDESFDVVVSVNVFEHVDDLYDTLLECRRVLKRSGLIFLHFPPFYSPWGAHLEGWINFPWPHVLFPDSVLLAAADRIEIRLRQNEGYIETAQVNWRQYSRLPELNRATAGQFRHLLHALGLHVVHHAMLPFGRHYLQRKEGAARYALPLLQHAARLPILEEVITTKMAYVLAKSLTR